MIFPGCRGRSILIRGAGAVSGIIISLWAHAALAAPALIALTVGFFSTDSLVSINPTTGAITTIGSGLPDGLSNDSYALNSAGSQYYYEEGSSLVVVNSTTGALIGTHTLSASLIGMAYNAAGGTLLGLTSGDSLVSINPATGGLTTIGSGLPNGLVNAAFAFDPATGQFVYQSAVNKLTVVNATTGALVANYNLSTQLDSLTYDSVTGSLLALTYPGSGDQLVSINPSTGQVTAIGSANLPDILSDDANAFNAATNQFYYYSFNQLIVVNAATGAQTGSPSLSTSVYGLAVPGSVATPEPASVAVLLSGLGMLGVIQYGSQSRRRRGS